MYTNIYHTHIYTYIHRFLPPSSDIYTYMYICITICYIYIYISIKQCNKSPQWSPSFHSSSTDHGKGMHLSNYQGENTKHDWNHMKPPTAESIVIAETGPLFGDWTFTHLFTNFIKRCEPRARAPWNLPHFLSVRTKNQAPECWKTWRNHF